MNLTFTMKFSEVPEGFIGFVDELPGANTQGRTIEETRSNLLEAIELVLETNRMLADNHDKSYYRTENLTLMAV